MQEKLRPFYEAAAEETVAYKQAQPQKELEKIISDQERAPSLVCAISKRDDVSAIGEHKRMSPSEGEIKAGSSVAWTAEQYRLGGAAALSILTQQKHFGGSPQDLVDARSASSLPILRKDFISDEYQLYQAKALGASAALLIVGGLTQGRLQDLQEEASGIGLECLVEVHSEEELERAMEFPPALLGINNRNLTNMKVDLKTTEELIEHVPGDMPVVSESGHSVNNPDHIAELRRLKVDGVLIGTSLMRESDPARALSSWLAN